MRLKITIPGATPAEIERGLAAARRVFAGAGVTAHEVAYASWRREALDTAGVYALEHHVHQLQLRAAPAGEIAAAEAELAELKRQPYLHDLTDREAEIADYWRGADVVAVRACCEGWTERPETAELELESDPDSLPSGREADPGDGRDEAAPPHGHAAVA